MEIVHPAEGAYEHGDAERFVGQVWLSPIKATPGGTSMAVVSFSPTARTHWHRHPGGQLLYVVSGRGRVRSEDGDGQVLLPGLVVMTPPGEWHFHGADDDSPMTHVAVNVDGPPEWGQPVTEAEYNQGF